MTYLFYLHILLIYLISLCVNNNYQMTDTGSYRVSMTTWPAWEFVFDTIDLKRIHHFRLHDVVPDRDNVSGDGGTGRMSYATDRGTNFRSEDYGRRWL